MRKLASLAVVVACAVPVAAQDAAVDVMEIARQIRRNMVLVEDSLGEVDAEVARRTAEQVARDIERLVRDAQEAGEAAAAGLAERARQASRAGRQVVSDIDRLIDNMGC